MVTPGLVPGLHRLEEVHADGVEALLDLDVDAKQLAGEHKHAYIWNHVEDGKTMQLVPSKLHERTGHTGGAKLLESGVVKPAK
jgi:hypothetical protein